MFSYSMHKVSSTYVLMRITYLISQYKQVLENR
jgi:hypothetical protein